MSTETEVKNTETIEQPARRKRASMPGRSILAQGEPLLWLTGGSLAICFAMIIGLLVLVLASGLGTFWPTALIQVTLRDGQTFMGEVTRKESYILTKDMVASMPPEIAASAQEILDSQTRTKAKRRLFRTGNFDLTNSHFHWISEFEFATAMEVTPEWAMVVERVEWGRFYGTPTEFAIIDHREIGSHEAELLSMIQFLQSNAWRLSGDEATEFQALLAPLQDEYEALRDKKIAAFLASVDDGDQQRVDVVLDGGQVRPLGEFAGDENVVAIHRVWEQPESAWAEFQRWHTDVRDRFHRRRELETEDIGHVNSRVEAARLGVRRAEIDHDAIAIGVADNLLTVRLEIEALTAARQENERTAKLIARRFGSDSKLAKFSENFKELLSNENIEQAKEPRSRLANLEADIQKLPEPVTGAIENFVDVTRQCNSETAAIVEEINAIKRENARYELRAETAQAVAKTLQLGDVVRAYLPNQLSLAGKLGIYGSRWSEFVWDDPREANSEGGVFPAIWGTVAMTLIMSIVVVPFGVLAALYLREYAKAGPIVSAVRISINNLAGVPSIVFGVFGLGFFCYVVGAFVDGGPRNANLPVWPKNSWFAVVGILAAVSFAAFLFSLRSMTSRRKHQSRSARIFGYAAIVLWLTSSALFLLIVATTPFFDGFYETRLPNPVFGKGGLLWSSLTLSLLTLPVVIVATEEALSAVPNSLREGSYACGAGKWQTIRRIVLPHAMPGIMTGMILAMARGAGEVAPLMLVGAVKLAPELPLDGNFPFLHPDRSFMHLGFHIYDLGFQSQNSEAAKPMVFTTTLLLILLIALLNITAVWLRSRLRKRFAASAF